MIVFVFRHLLESTVFCALVCSAGYLIRAGATTRYLVWLIGVSKFAIPSVLLTGAGMRLALYWPATRWLSSIAARISIALTGVFGFFPSQIGEMGSRTLQVAFSVWAVGTVLLLGVWFGRLRNMRWQWSTPNREEQRMLFEARELLGIGAAIEIRVSENAAGPALRGFWRPTVYIPAQLSQILTPSEFRAVLLHELAHAKRCDNLTAVVVHGLTCMFWFHPLLWLMERGLAVERERACDELVIACGTVPQIYAAGILKVCRFQILKAAGVSAMAGCDLKRRLDLILTSRLPTPLTYVPRLFLGTLTLLIPIFPMAGGYCSQCVSNGQTIFVHRGTAPCPTDSQVSPKQERHFTARSCLE